MGNTESIDIPGGGTEGYHILRVQENSPGSRAGLQAFFDFIVAINGIRLDKDNDTLKQILKNGIGKQLPLTIYSSKTQSVRSVNVEPSDTWGGQGLLGVSIKFCSFEGANENVWHILEVHPKSPADLAGLQPFSDYIIGADSVIHESEDLYALIENHEGRNLKLYVYNSNDDSCREITIMPNHKWGGEGLLGCGIGYGYLHRIPVRGSVPPTTLTKNRIEIDKVSAVPHDEVSTPVESNIISPPIVEPELYTKSNPVESDILQVQNSVVGPPPTVQNSTISNENQNPFRNQASVTASHILPPSNIPQFRDIANFTNGSTTDSTIYSSNLPTPSSIPQFANVNMIDQNQINSSVPMYPVNFSQSNTSQVTPFPTMPFIQPLQIPLSPGNVLQPSNDNISVTSIPSSIQQPLFYNPEIAAQSAQQLLQSNPNFSNS
ncbi:hypothetical protein WA026_006693 [Henosepilachna vigintioctopunctata]|uniref:PDZ GRASP-type domain-containing protein n=1 Tax=Henosepilachna vigintioctopunctata TaxID=420089 RepID=A0AAW1U7G5_9CUCU